ncbi:MAG: FliH/SctL family protein [Rhodocyclaceae bacterium]|nr:FliH/SctL family protein [Rhodocyclaceae bacterium]
MSNLTAWERWELASFDEARGGAAPMAAESEALPAQLPTAAEIAQIQEQARAEGFQQGHDEGYQAGLQKGHDETHGEAEQLARAAAKLESGLAALDAEVALELLALAIELAREVVRQEISARPDTLLAVVREALTQLPHQHAAIYLHPEDASLLRSYMGDQLAHAGHRIHEDFKLARGDCLLETGGSQVDATVAMRWRRVLAGLGIAATDDAS